MAALEPIVRSLAEKGALAEPTLQKLAQGSNSVASFLAAVSAQGVAETDLVEALAGVAGMPGVDLSRTTIDLDILDTVPRVVAESDLVLPLSNEGGRLHIGVSAAAEDYSVVDELHFITGLEVSAYVALPGPLEAAITAAYDARQAGDRFWRGPAVEDDAPAAIAVVMELERQGLAGPTTNEVLEATEELEELEELDDELAVEVGEEASADDEAEVVGTAVRVGPATILAVDDDPEILKLAEKTLKSAKHNVELARDGREAEQKLAEKTYDLLLLDAMLPHVHGFEICARLKASPRTRGMPVILMTAIYRGWRFAHDAKTTFGADDYLEKPFHLPDLLKRVDTLLAGAAAAPVAPDVESLYQEGMGLLEKNQFADARKALEKAAKKDPLSARTQFALARAMEKEGDVFHAISAYERAIELRPNLFQALKAVAALYESRGFRRKAVEALERAVHAAPDAATRDGLRKQLIKLI